MVRLTPGEVQLPWYPGNLHMNLSVIVVELDLVLLLIMFCC